jgi:hypothetical protein
MYGFCHVHMKIATPLASPWHPSGCTFRWRKWCAKPNGRQWTEMLYTQSLMIFSWDLVPYINPQKREKLEPGNYAGHIIYTILKTRFYLFGG